MRKVLAASAAVLLYCLPAFAQTTVTASDPGAGVSAFLATANDAAVVKAEGRLWASVQWQVTVAGSGTLTAEVTSDRSLVNWVAAPYSRRIDASSSNPSVSAFQNATPVAGTFETPLPGNTVAFRLRYQGGGTTTALFLSAGTPYVAGNPITATLGDVTEGSTGAGIAATVFDISGWSATAYSFTTPTTQVFSLKFLDSAGATVLPTITTTAASSAAITLSPDATSLSSTTLSASTINALGVVWPRVSVSLPAGGTVTTGRVIVFARR